jgi:hypothetical protein
MSTPRLAVPPGAALLFSGGKNNMSDPTSPSFVNRIIANDSAKKGVAAALAGVLIAVVQEAIWPSS